MTRLEKVLDGLDRHSDPSVHVCWEAEEGVVTDSCPYHDRNYSPLGCETKLMKDAAALLRDYDEALRLMVYQYCCWDTPEIDPETEFFFNRHMSAGEAAFRVLGIENWQEVPGDFI